MHHVQRSEVESQSKSGSNQASQTDCNKTELLWGSSSVPCNTNQILITTLGGCVISLWKIRLPQGRPSKVAMTMQYVYNFGESLRDDRRRYGVRCTFLDYFWSFRSEIIHHESPGGRLMLILNASACPGFIKNRLSTYRNKMLVP